MPRFEDEPKPRKPIKGIDRPPSREFTVFSDAFSEIRSSVEKITEPTSHPVLSKLVDLFRKTPQRTEPPEDKSTGSSMD